MNKLCTTGLGASLVEETLSYLSRYSDSQMQTWCKRLYTTYTSIRIVQDLFAQTIRTPIQSGETRVTSHAIDNLIERGLDAVIITLSLTSSFKFSD